MVVYGIDVGGTTVKLGCFDENGELLRKDSVATDLSDRGARILADTAEKIRSMTEEAGLLPRDIRGVGIGVPGAVLPDGTVNCCPNLGWGVVQAARELSDMLDGIPVRIANDANAAALGEARKGAGKGFSDMVMVTLGTGVGGGVIVHDRIVQGAFGAAGEIGHIHVSDTDTEQCSCGNYGCLEMTCAIRGVMRLARKYHLDGVQSPKEFFDLVKTGNKKAQEAAGEYARALGKGLSMISCVIDPEAYVIGGGIAAAGCILTDMVKEYYRQYAFHTSKETKILPARLGNDAGIYGCACLALE